MVRTKEVVAVELAEGVVNEHAIEILLRTLLIGIATAR